MAASSGGYDFDVSALGRYDVNFGSNGLCAMTIGGSDMPSLEYTVTEEGISMDYYGMSFLFTFTETGFQMNYAGAMLLTYEPEE